MKSFNKYSGLLDELEGELIVHYTGEIGKIVRWYRSIDSAHIIIQCWISESDKYWEQHHSEVMFQSYEKPIQILNEVFKYNKILFNSKLWKLANERI